ncbi:MAG: alpha/beta hydrolase [Pseudomonadota bacterium]
MFETRRIREIDVAVPFDGGRKTQALVASSDKADWRLVVLPGTPCRKELYYRFLRCAPADLDVAVVSRLGFGAGHREPVLDFRDQVRVVEPFLGDRKTIVMGVSYGGALALKSAMTYPAVSGAVTVAALVSEPFDYARMLADLTAQPQVAPLVPNRLHTTRAEVEGRRTQIGPLLEALRGFAKPVEVLHGDFDHLVSLKDAHLLTQHIGASAAFEKVHGGTHYMELQYPRRIYGAVNRAIARAQNAETATGTAA